MAIGYLLVAVVAAALAVFALQNGAPAPVRFLSWNIDGIPLAGVILGAFAAGLVIAGVPLAIQRWRARSQLRRLEERLRTLEAQQAELQKRPLPSQLQPPREGL